MPLAITLRFDPLSASMIEGWWRVLAMRGIDTDRAGLGYAPHITLAIYPDDSPVERLRGAVEQFAGVWTAPPVALSGFGVFPGPPSILWAAPVVTTELLARHAALHAALPGMRGDPHYRTGAWVPHVTLSGALTDPGRALAALVPLWCPVSGGLDRLEIVRFRPVEVLLSRDLACFRPPARYRTLSRT